MAIYYTRFTCPKCGVVDVTETCAVISDPPDGGRYYTDIPNADYPVTSCLGWYYGKGYSGRGAKLVACENRQAMIAAGISISERGAQ